MHLNDLSALILAGESETLEFAWPWCLKVSEGVRWGDVPAVSSGAICATLRRSVPFHVKLGALSEFPDHIRTEQKHTQISEGCTPIRFAG